MSTPNTSALVALSDLLDRATLARRANLQFAGERDLTVVLGYKTVLRYEDYYGKYQRQDIASRIVDMPPRATWKGAPWVTDTEDDAETPFVRDWTAIAKRLRVWNRLRRADRLAGIGRYGVLLIGLKDGRELGEEAGNVQGPDGVLYLAPYSERFAKIKTWETDHQSPRFGLPREYEITLSSGIEDFRPAGAAGGKVTVHWSRILHIAEDLIENEVYGTPRLQRVYDRLDDLAKLAGGSAEIFWLIAAQILHINIDKDMRVQDADLEALDEQIQEVMHNLRRTLQTQGASVQAIGGEDVNPGQTYEMLRQLISAAADIPERVLFGSERGELASTQDQEEWHERIASRRTDYAEPVILRPLIDRLVQLGALSPPRDGQYEVQWPPLGEPTMDQRAQTAVRLAQAARTLSQDDPSQVVAPHELREEILGWSPEPAPPDGIAANRRRPGKVFAASDSEALIRRVERLIGPGHRREIRSAIERVRRRIDLDTLEAAVASGSVDSVIAASFAEALAQELEPVVREALERALTEGGEFAAAALPAGLTLAFDLTNPRAVEWVRENVAREVRQVTEETVQAIRSFVADAFEKGITPKETARRIFGQIGLTERQQRAVESFRARLEEEGVTGARLDRRVETFVDRKLRERSRLIADNEILTSAKEGQRLLWQQAVDEGLIRGDMDRLFLTGDGRWVRTMAHIRCRCTQALTILEDGTAWLTWITTPDERLCQICAPMPALPENLPPAQGAA